jgi:glycosyltransferase involved in cell wall biosynthesis
MKSVLIITFAFPPSSSIGGRRWSFFADYLNRDNIDVYVITSDFEKDSTNCPWIKTIKYLDGKITYLSHKTPFHRIYQKPSSIINKVRYRISTFRVNKIGKNLLHDRSLFFAQDAFKKAIEIIRENKIKNVIVTGGPFYLVYKISQLKNVFGKDINLIVDLRDPWTEFWGDKLDSDYKKSQREMNDFVFKTVDKVFVPYPDMKRKIIYLWANESNKIKVIPHAYDDDIFKGLDIIKGAYHKMFYAGSLYEKKIKEYSLLKQLLKLEKISLKFYSFSNSDNEFFDDISCVNKMPIVSQQKLLEENQQCGMALFISWTKDYLTSKFFELVKQGKFILYIGEKGEISDFIVKENLGYCILSDEVDEIDTFCIKELRDKFENFQPNKTFIDKYSFSKITNKVIDELN